MHCIVQARMASKRMPGKVLKKLVGESILLRVINQIKKTKKISKIIIATSKNKIDLKIVNFCKRNNIKYFRGEHHNVAKRFVDTLTKYPTKYFLRICADSPLIDPVLIDKMINILDKKKYDIVTNVFPRTFPRGHSVEILKSEILIKNYKIFNKYQEEHLTSFFYENHKKFTVHNLRSNTNKSKKNYCVDKVSDILRLKKYIEKNKNND
tara:strand:- start:130 stop:756 length:627 start_codon:yes stop_codon:yes gene_type:complete